jgi:transposase
MGRPIKKLIISTEDRLVLERAYRSTSNRRYAARCRIILLKSSPERAYSSDEISELVDLTRVVVQRWIFRYEEEGLEGLKSRPRSGRPTILSTDQDGQTVKEAVKEARQRLGKIHDEIEQKTDKKFSPPTLRRFLKKLAESTNVSVSDRAASRIQGSTK